MPLFAASVALFFLAYPRRRGGRRVRRLILAALLAGAALSLGALALPILYAVGRLVNMATELGSFLLAGGLLVSALRATRERGARRGLIVICAGTAVAVLPFALLYLAPSVAGHRAIMPAEHAALALGLLPLSFAYAAARHDALSVPLLQRWLVHGLLYAALGLPVLALMAARDRLGALLPGPLGALAPSVAVVAAAGLLFGWARGPAQAALDRLVFKDSYDYRASLQGLSRDLSLAGNLDTLGAALPATLRRLMNLDFAVLLIQDKRGVTPCGAAGAYREDMLPALTAATAEAMDAPRVVPFAPGRGHGEAGVLVAPLRTGDDIVGRLCLGPKSSGEPFRAQDRDLLTTLSGHLAAIVRNAGLVDDLRDKVKALDVLNARLQRAQEEERARLSADLHDEPLQTALSLRRDLALIGAPPGPRERSMALIGQLRALCATTRPAALDDLGLHAAIDQLVRAFSAQAGVPVLLDADPEVAECGQSPAAELVLYRAVQEALTNVRRHARARTVRVALTCSTEGVRLLVGDDGVGFAAPACLESLALDDHHGLAGLYGRVRRVGGRLHVTSAPGEGTTVRVDLPLAAIVAEAPGAPA